MRYTQNGAAVTNLSVAVNRKYQSQGETVEETQWFDVSAWNRLAETVAEYVTKGMLVQVVGRLELKEWQDNQGNPRASLGITAHTVTFLSKTEAAPQQSQPQQSQPQQRGGGYQQRPQQPYAPAHNQQPPQQGYNPQGGYYEGSPQQSDDRDLPW